MCGPVRASNAGRIVRAAAIEVATTIAAAKPRLVMTGMPANASPQIAATTVTPAHSTDEPAVDIASTAASLGAAPARMASRWRVTMNSA
jgi:hypothetical protein